jgi:hypothetical protein
MSANHTRTPDEDDESKKRKRSQITLVKLDENTTKKEDVIVDGEIVSPIFTARSTSLVWSAPPKAIAICARRGDEDVRNKLVIFGNWLVSKYNAQVYVDPTTHAEIGGLFNSWGNTDLHSKIDVIASMGGDGTLMHVASLFPKAHPPVLAFNFGSMGFLTPFGLECAENVERVFTRRCVQFADFEKFETQIPEIFVRSHVTLRLRLCCAAGVCDVGS